MEMIRGLVYVSDGDEGYYRKKVGRGFVYMEDNSKVVDEEILNRIKALKIPPIWKDVWISKKKNGYLQVTGKDQKGRKQYLYHPLWSEHRNTSKFRKMSEFARILPIIREASLKHMSKSGWSKEKVLGLVVQLLNEAFIRIGNLHYKEQNQTYGLTTLRRKHLKVNGAMVAFQYKAKSGKYRNVGIENKRIGKLIKQCSELPGHEIFRYYDQEDKKWYCIDSHEVNEYLRIITGEQFSSKDFRTWGGTVTALDRLEEAKREVEESPRKSLIPTLIKKVAEKLGNTVAVCREYYIHPYILNVIENDDIKKYSIGINRKYLKFKDSLSKNELIALNIIENYENDKPKKGLKGA